MPVATSSKKSKGAKNTTITKTSAAPSGRKCSTKDSTGATAKLEGKVKREPDPDQKQKTGSKPKFPVKPKVEIKSEPMIKPKLEPGTTTKSKKTHSGRSSVKDEFSITEGGIASAKTSGRNNKSVLGQGTAQRRSLSALSGENWKCSRKVCARRSLGSKATVKTEQKAKMPDAKKAAKPRAPPAAKGKSVAKKGNAAPPKGIDVNRIDEAVEELLCVSVKKLTIAQQRRRKELLKYLVNKVENFTSTDDEESSADECGWSSGSETESSSSGDDSYDSEEDDSDAFSWSTCSDDGSSDH